MRVVHCILIINGISVRDILSLGGKFFLIQIAGIVMFQSANIIISQLSSPQDVTVYNVVYKYFSVVTMVFNIILGTLWSAYTDAYAKGDMKWIVQVVSKMVTCWKLFLVLTVVMLVASPWIYILWLGTEVASLVPFSISILCAVYVSIFSWSSIYAFFLNGVGKIKIQLYVAVSLSILYIPLAISLNIYFGVNGIIGALCIVSVIAGVLVQIQYKKIIKQKATGIWNE